MHHPQPARKQEEVECLLVAADCLQEDVVQAQTAACSRPPFPKEVFRV